MKVSVVASLMVFLASSSLSSVFTTILLIACRSLSFDNVAFEQSLCSIMIYNRSV